MPSVTIELFEGRTVEQKRTAAVKVTQALVEALGVKREIVKIRFVDIQKHDVAWGGELVADRKS